MSRLIRSNVYGFIYKISNLINGKIYIGQHKGLDFGDYWGSGTLLNKAYKKYGRDNFSREIIEYAGSKQELNFLEQFYIQKMDSIGPNGYNIASGGRGGYTGPATPETCEKIRKKLKGRKFTEEHIRNMTLSKRGKPGHPHTEEEKRKISLSHMGIEPWNKGKGRPVEQLTMEGDHVRTWASMAEANANGFNMSKISECINGKREHHRRFKWRFS